MDKIKFIEASHRYLTEDGKDLISVSKFMDRFKEKIDWKKKAAGVASRITKEGTPTTTKQILDKWENKRNQSAQIGTNYHAIREQELIDNVVCNFYNTDCKKVEHTIHQGNKLSIPIHQIENNTVYPELMIYDLEHMICGQSDKVIVTKNKINIWDYKTDKEISFKGWSNMWTVPRKLLPPLQHLDDCSGNIYAIKMSMYMYLLWKANKGRFQLGEIIIEHVSLKRDPLNDDIPILKDAKPVVEKIEKIKLPYLKKEVIGMLKTIKP